MKINVGMKVSTIEVSLSIILKKSKIEKYICSYPDTNVEVEEQSTVHGLQEEKNTMILTSNSNVAQTKEESISESDLVYMRECIEFLDNLNFNDDRLYDDDLNYIDASI